MNESAPQSLPAAIPRGILAESAERPLAAFHFCNVRPGAAVLGQMLEPVVRSGRRALVLTRTAARAALLSRGLWCYRRTAFLPHGTDGEKAALQPVLLTATPVNVNGADVLVLPDGEPIGDIELRVAAAPEFLRGFALVVTLLDATDPDAVRSAGRSWAAARDLGFETVAFEREAPAAARRGGPAASSDLESPVPLRWHRIS